MSNCERTWWKESVVYQIYPRSFKDSNNDGIGDINGITEKMDYLKELGIDVVWLSPIYKSPNDDNGYDISDYYGIMDEFGAIEDFERMLNKAHDCNIKIIMDLVVNHTSDEHYWFTESKKSKDNPYRDYYMWREPKEGREPNNWGSCFSGSAWQFDKETEMYYLHLFSKKQPDLNWDNPKVRREVFDMMSWWHDKGIEGFRMDVISLISKKAELPDGKPCVNGYASFNEAANGPHVHKYLKEMRKEVLNKYDTLTVGECSGVTIEEAKMYASTDGSELNMVFQFEHIDLDSDENGNKWTDKKMDLVELKTVLSKWQKGLEGIAWNSLFWCNHDQPRIVSRLGDDKEYREISAKMLATCLHFMQGTPYIYQGEELGMTNVKFDNISDFRDLDSINAYYELSEKGVFTKEEMLRFLNIKSRDNARTPMQWNKTKNAGFSDGEPWIKVNPNYININAEEQVEREDSIFNYYKKLIKLRKDNPVMVYGSYDLILEDSSEVYAYTRKLDEDKLLVCCNFTDENIVVEIPEEFMKSRIFLNNYTDEKTIEEMFDNRAKKTIKLKPYESIVLK